MWLGRISSDLFALFETELLPFLRLFFVPRLVGKSCKHRSDKGLRFTESAFYLIVLSFYTLFAGKFTFLDKSCITIGKIEFTSLSKTCMTKSNHCDYKVV